MAAFVGLPSLSKAIFAAGPFAFCTSSLLVSATLSIFKIILRGVEQLITSPWAMRALSNASAA